MPTGTGNPGVRSRCARRGRTTPVNSAVAASTKIVDHTPWPAVLTAPSTRLRCRKTPGGRHLAGLRDSACEVDLESRSAEYLTWHLVVVGNQSGFYEEPGTGFAPRDVDRRARRHYRDLRSQRCSRSIDRTD